MPDTALDATHLAVFFVRPLSPGRRIPCERSRTGFRAWGLGFRGLRFCLSVSACFIVRCVCVGGRF